MAAEILVRRVRPTDVDAVASAMRSADQAEAALLGFTAADGLRLSVRASVEVWTVDIDGVPAAMFGLGRAAGSTVAPWLLATDRFAAAWVGVARRARRIVRSWAAYSALENMCDARNEVALAFLRWLGFDVEPVVPGRTMVRFSMPKAVR